MRPALDAWFDRCRDEMKKTFSEFFAGIGLMRLGLEEAGWQSVWANDIDPKKVEMYYSAFQNRHIDYRVQDVHSVQSTEVPTTLLATASFPCTDLSLAGNRVGMHGSQSGAFWGFLDVLRKMDGRRPPIVLLENVPGLVTSRQGEDFSKVIAALNKLQYSCDVFALDAAHFLPHSRQRLFVVAVRDAPNTGDPVAFLDRRPGDLKTKQLVDFIGRYPKLGWSMRDIPAPPRRKTGGLSKLLERLPENDSRWWARDRVDYLVHQMSALHRPVAEGMTNSPVTRYGTVYRRVRYGQSRAELRTDDIAGCLRTPRGGSSRQILFVAGRGKRRARFMTPRECALLMGAGHYPLNIPPNQAYFGFGDAVAVPVVAWVAENVLNPLTSEMRLEARVATKQAARAVAVG